VFECQTKNASLFANNEPQHKPLSAPMLTVRMPHRGAASRGGHFLGAGSLHPKREDTIEMTTELTRKTLGTGVAQHQSTRYPPDALVWL